MKTLKTYSIIIIGLIITTLAFVLSQKPITKNQEYSNSHFKLDSLKITTVDKEIKNKIFLEGYNKNDSLKPQQNVKKLIASFNKNIESIITSKNNKIFKLLHQKTNWNNKKPNNWLLIFIILISGFIGGYARTKKDLVSELSIKLEKLNGKMELLTTEDISKNNIADNLNKIKEIRENLKAEKTEKITANILFGVIASSLAFLAMKTFDSKILDFASDIDYFIFMGWCLLGALFAKKWIKKIYDNIS